MVIDNLFAFCLTLLIIVPNIYSRMELFPTFNSVGVTKYSSEKATDCFIQYCYPGGECHDGYPLTRITTGKFVGSIFWLERDTQITVHVRCAEKKEVVFYDEETLMYIHEDFEKKTIRTLPMRVFPSVFDATQKLYVDIVSVSPNCTESEPCSFDEAVPKIKSGTQLFFFGGVYYMGSYIVDEETQSGTESNPIVFRTYGNGQVIFDGSELITGLSLHAAPGIYRTTYSLQEDVNNVVMIRTSDSEQTRLIRYTNRTKFETLPYTSPVDSSPMYGYYVDTESNIFDINIGPDLTFADYTFRFGVHPYFMWIGNDHFYFSDIAMRYYGYGIYRCGLYFRGGSYGWVRNMFFDHMPIGVYLKFKSDYMLIENSVFRDSKYRLNWDSVKDDDGDGGLEAGGIVLGTGGEGNVTPGRGLIIRYCAFYNFFDAFNLGSSADNEDNFYHLPTNEIDVHDNVISKCRDDGFECDGICQNVRIFDNHIEYTLAGLSLAPAKIGPTYVLNNIIVEIHGWTGFKFIFGDHSRPSGEMIIMHNVVWSRIAGSGASIGYFPWKNSVWRNNILIGSSRCISVGFEVGKVDSPISLDYDVCARSTDGPPFYWEGIGNLYTLEEFVQKTGGQESHGILVPSENICNIFSNNETMVLNPGFLRKGVHVDGVNGANPDRGILFNHDLPSVPLFYDVDESGTERKNNFLCPSFFFASFVSFCITIFLSFLE